jgi:hypothetical protein
MLLRIYLKISGAVFNPDFKPLAFKQIGAGFPQRTISC